MIESGNVRLCDLFVDVVGSRIAGDPQVQVHSLCYRSDLCGPDSLFFCVPGFVRDGHDYAADAVSRGAVALCVERLLDLPVAQVLVPDVRRAMGIVSRRFFSDPSTRLMTVGITGTNGKTTTAFLAAHLLDSAGFAPGSWARSSAASAVRTCRPAARPLRRSTSNAIWPSCWIRATKRRSWRSRLTLSSSVGCLGRLSGPRVHQSDPGPP